MSDTAKVPVQVRPGTKEDAKIIAKLATETLREAFAEHENSADTEAYITQYFHKLSVQSELADTKNHPFWIALDGEKAVGYAKLNRKTEKPRNLKGFRAVELQRLYVYEKNKGADLEKQLLELALQQAREDKFQAVFVSVWEKNEQALNFYAEMGFERFGWHYFLFGFGRQRDFWMVKYL
ncbi:GNAT family N-acetyltransferase [Siphonobacter sp. SORGH_AS_1065]|uniref:GNAT family N-acetyltransferase n=1 Tax=Siphonobacter sp. SORGH_AS_1065 TaxID=3041795 RepID=UPI00277F9C4D|nr:GNAT family N-acetyltransferase [Siphonobacter sp. SORGH_AS_1065]MDQ1086278.1 ribosomal protein S18 acetylase RimI-like enzyme [Siphonobacter sp. SORGH_AS_1065]